MMIPKDPSQYAFHLLRDLYAVEDVEKLDPKAVSDRLRSVHKGWSVEHEFAAIATWLGNPRLLVSSDEVLHTDNHYYRVPDFMVVVRKGDRDVPFLVEVKSSTEDKLVWTEKYRAAIRRFADMLGLPVLIAWKYQGMWTLVDVGEIRKKNTSYHLTLEHAAKHNLMSALFGNVFLVVKEGFRLEFKLKFINPVHAATELLPEGQYEFVVADAGLYTNKGRVPKDIADDLFPLLLARCLEPTTEREGEFLRQIFPADHENMFNASQLLMAKLSWGLKDEEEVDWLVALRNGLAAPIKDLRGVLNRAIEVGALQYVFEQQPETVPAFLKGIDLKVR